VPFPSIDGHELKPGAARVRLDFADGRDDDGLEARPIRVQALDFDSGAREPLGDLRRRRRKSRNESA
jgi:hypothetical protein